MPNSGFGSFLSNGFVRGEHMACVYHYNKSSWRYARDVFSDIRNACRKNMFMWYLLL